LDEGEFPLKDYGHFAQVLERVQQWTVDKESLSLPAPLTPGYEQAQRVLLLGSQRRQYVCDFLTDLLGQGVDKLTGDQTWLLFKQCVVTELLQSSRAVKALDLRFQFPESISQGAVQLETLERMIAELYCALNFVVEANAPGELLNLLVGELGLPVDCQVTPEALNVGGTGAASSTPTIPIYDSVTANTADPIIIGVFTPTAATNHTFTANGITASKGLYVVISGTVAATLFFE
jgi:hypothetical protein